VTHRALTVRSVAVEPASSDAFAPFGTLLVPGGRRGPDNYGGKIRSWYPCLLEADGQLEFVLCQLGVREFTVQNLERHFQFTQTFIPLGGDSILMVVARPEARLHKGVPAPEEVRAFLVPGDAAVNLSRGTWHEPPYGLIEGSLLLAIHQKFPDDHPDGVPLPDLDKRSLAERAGLVIKLELPDGLT